MGGTISAARSRWLQGFDGGFRRLVLWWRLGGRMLMDAAAPERLRHDRLHRVLANGPDKSASQCEVLRAIYGNEETRGIRLVAYVGRVGVARSISPPPS
jgi:hypothetical protein